MKGVQIAENATDHSLWAEYVHRYHPLGYKLRLFTIFSIGLGLGEQRPVAWLGYRGS